MKNAFNSKSCFKELIVISAWNYQICWLKYNLLKRQEDWHLTLFNDEIFKSNIMTIWSVRRKNNYMIKIKSLKTTPWSVVVIVPLSLWWVFIMMISYWCLHKIYLIKINGFTVIKIMKINDSDDMKKDMKSSECEL